MEGQLTIPGLEIYESRLEDLRSQGEALFVQIGQVLAEAKQLFKSHPDEVWVGWLKGQGYRSHQAARAIAAYETIKPEQVALLPATAIKMIASADEVARSAVRSTLAQGQRLTVDAVKQIIKDSRSIAVGKKVYFLPDSSCPGGEGIVDSIDGEIITIEINGGFIPCFAAEISLVKPKTEQLSIVPSVRSGKELEARLSYAHRELALLKGTLFKIWDEDPEWAIELEERHPNIREWEALL